MWHWASPTDPASWDRAHTVRVSHWGARSQYLATQCYRSQFDPVSRLLPVLPAFVVQRLLTVGAGVPCDRALPDDYFDRIYAGTEVRGGVVRGTKRKYAITLALLPRPVPTRIRARMLDRDIDRVARTACDHVTAVDVADVAIHTADVRLREARLRGQVTLARASLDARGHPGRSTYWCSARSPTT